jgi:hypothetical protein
MSGSSCKSTIWIRFPTDHESHTETRGSTQDIGLEGDRLVDVGYFDRNMIAAVYLDTVIKENRWEVAVRMHARSVSKGLDASATRDAYGPYGIPEKDLFLGLSFAFTSPEYPSR